ncbi:MAG: DUF6368 family protein [Pseudomonadota bacterium]
MAGPTVGILVPIKIDQKISDEISKYIYERADEVRRSDFWIDGHPLIYSLGPDYPEELDDYSGIESSLGWQPKDIIGLCAMCNGREDHIKLGEITLAVARIVNGYVMFGSSLNFYTSDPAILESEDFFEFKDESIIGVDLFSKWLNHKDFYMVK